MATATMEAEVVKPLGLYSQQFKDVLRRAWGLHRRVGSDGRLHVRGAKSYVGAYGLYTKLPERIVAEIAKAAEARMSEALAGTGIEARLQRVGGVWCRFAVRHSTTEPWSMAATPSEVESKKPIEFRVRVTQAERLAAINRELLDAVDRTINREKQVVGKAELAAAFTLAQQQTKVHPELLIDGR
jgi:hypothetical protein